MEVASSSKTEDLHLSGFIWMTSQPDMQKIWIIGFFFENRLQWQLQAEKKILKLAILGYTFIYIQIKH